MLILQEQVHLNKKEVKKKEDKVSRADWGNVQPDLSLAGPSSPRRGPRSFIRLTEIPSRSPSSLALQPRPTAHAPPTSSSTTSTGFLDAATAARALDPATPSSPPAAPPPAPSPLSAPGRLRQLCARGPRLRRHRHSNTGAPAPELGPSASRARPRTPPHLARHHHAGRLQPPRHQHRPRCRPSSALSGMLRYGQVAPEVVSDTQPSSPRLCTASYPSEVIPASHGLLRLSPASRRATGSLPLPGYARVPHAGSPRSPSVILCCSCEYYSTWASR